MDKACRGNNQGHNIDTKTSTLDKASQLDLGIPSRIIADVHAALIQNRQRKLLGRDQGETSRGSFADFDQNQGARYAGMRRNVSRYHNSVSVTSLGDILVSELTRHQVETREEGLRLAHRLHVSHLKKEEELDKARQMAERRKWEAIKEAEKRMQDEKKRIENRSQEMLRAKGRALEEETERLRKKLKDEIKEREIALAESQERYMKEKTRLINENERLSGVVTDAVEMKNEADRRLGYLKQREEELSHHLSKIISQREALVTVRNALYHLSV